MRLIFFGSSNYCFPVLESLDKNFQLTTVITKPNSAAQQFAISHQIKFYTPQDKNELLHLISQIRHIRPDLAIVADYGLIIPPEIFNIPKHKTLNIHFSRLPDLRGPSPVQYVILRGDKSAWITIIIMERGMDTGDIIWQKEVKLSSDQAIERSSNETTESLYKKLFNIAASELPSIISKYVQNKLKPTKQNHAKATYTKILAREDGFIPPQILSVILSPDLKSGRRIPIEVPITKGILRFAQDDNWVTFLERAIRALFPWPGVWTEIQITDNPSTSLRTSRKQITSKRLKILKAHLASQGQPLRDKLVLDVVQLEGKNPVSWKQFKEGHPGFNF